MLCTVTWSVFPKLLGACLVQYNVSFMFSRKCITGFIPEAVLRRSRDKFLNFPTRSQRKSYISNLRTTKSRYGMPYLGLVVVVYSHLRVSLLISLVIELCNQSRMLQ